MGYGWMIAPFLPIILVTIILAVVLGIVVSVISKMGAVTQPQNFTSAGGAVASAIGGVVAIYGFAIVGGYFVLLLTALAFYYLIQRRNDHFARQQLLFSTLNQLLSNGTQARPSETTSRLSHLSEDSVFEERQRAAGVWAILFLFVSPIVGLIIAYSLTQDLRKHEALQAEYRIALSEAFRDAGYGSPTFATPKLHNRDPLLFVILSAITAGLFWIYWFYTLLHDYNEHFAQQADFENQIVNLLKPPAPVSGRTCKACGASIPENARFCPSCGTPSS
jgi:predicted permease